MKKKLFAAYALICILIVVLTGVCIPLEGAARDFMLSESGVVEVGAALGYAICILLIISQPNLRFAKAHPYLPVILLVALLRELDFDKRFTTMGILQSRFYISDLVALPEKAIGLFCVGIIIGVITYALVKHSKALIKGVFALEPISIGLALIGFLLVTSKTIDGIGRKLGALGFQLSEAIDVNLAVLEEVMEFGVPMIIFVMLFCSLKTQQADMRSCGHQLQR